MPILLNFKLNFEVQESEKVFPSLSLVDILPSEVSVKYILSRKWDVDRCY